MLGHGQSWVGARGMWHLVLCSHLVLVWMAREGLMVVSSSVSTGDTCPPAQGDFIVPIPSSHPGDIRGIHSPYPICLPRVCSAGL